MATEASGFYSTMTATGTPWAGGVFYTDTNVWDTDFYDPDYTGDSSDGDTYNFDSQSSFAAFAFVGAHGTCDDADLTTCNSSADCGVFEYCAANPPSSYSSRCINGSARHLLTSSHDSSHGQSVDYSDGSVKWGEDSNSGGWAGAGTNGSNAVVFVVNSCGSKEPFFWGETKATYAGAMLINFTMPSSNVNKPGNWPSGVADLVTWSSRGSVLATYALNNPNQAISSGWFANLDSAPLSAGASCPDQTSNYAYGGGHGYTGCAANISASWAPTENMAYALTANLPWSQASIFTAKPQGNSWSYGLEHCNYDCLTYGFSK
jgi:hypothetical protein